MGFARFVILFRERRNWMALLHLLLLDQPSRNRNHNLLELIQRHVFVRIHRSTIVNLNKVRSVDAIPKGECLLHLDDGVSLKVSRNYRSAVQDLMG